MSLRRYLRCALFLLCLATSQAATVVGPDLPARVDLGIAASTAETLAVAPWLKHWATFGRLHGPDGQVSFCNGLQVFVGPLATSPAPVAIDLGLDSATEAIAFIANVSGQSWSDDLGWDIRSDYLWVKEGFDLQGNANDSVVTLRILQARWDLLPDFDNPILSLTFNKGFKLIAGEGYDIVPGQGLLSGRGPDIPVIVADFNGDGYSDLIIWNPGQDATGAFQYHPSNSGSFDPAPEVIFKNSPVGVVRAGVADIGSGIPALIIGERGDYTIAGTTPLTGASAYQGVNGREDGHTFDERLDFNYSLDPADTFRNVPVPVGWSDNYYQMQTVWRSGAPTDDFAISTGNVDGRDIPAIAINGLTGTAAANQREANSTTLIILNVGQGYWDYDYELETDIWVSEEIEIAPANPGALRIIGDAGADGYDDLVFTSVISGQNGPEVVSGLWHGGANWEPSTLDDHPDRNDAGGLFPAADLYQPGSFSNIPHVFPIVDPANTFQTAAPRILLIDTVNSDANLTALPPLPPRTTVVDPTLPITYVARPSALPIQPFADRNFTLTFDQKVTQVEISMDATLDQTEDLTLTVGQSGLTLVPFRGDSGIILTLNGEAPAATYQSVLRTLTYRNQEAAPIVGQRSLGLVVFGADLNEQFPWPYGSPTYVQQVVLAVKAGQDLAFSPIADPQTYNVPVLLEATSTSNLAVQFSVVSGPAAILEGNVLTFIGTGAVTVAANQPGNGTYAAAAQQTQTFAVQKASQAITFANPGSQVYGATVELDATADSGLAVTYSVVSGPASLSGSSLTIIGVGPVTVAADQGGDGNFLAAAQVVQSFTAQPASQTIAITDPGPQTFGVAPVSLTANASSGLAVTLSVVSGPGSLSGSTLTITGAGTVTVAANQGGNANFQAASQALLAISVNKAGQTIAFTAPPATLAYGAAPVTLDASTSSGLPIVFSVLSGPASLSGGTLTITGVGTVVVAADQAGNGNFNPATQVTRTITVQKGDQTITFADPGTPTFGAAPLTLSATASSGLPVTLSVLSGPGTLDGNVLTLTGAGTVTVAADQAGDANWNAAARATRAISVQKAAQTISLTDPALTTTTYGVAPLSVSASASSGLPVVYSLLSGPGTLTGTTLTITGVGTITIAMNQAGNANYLAATQLTQAIEVQPKLLTVTGITAADKIYDGSTSAILDTSAAALVGVLSGDLANVALVKTNAAGSFAEPSSGADKPVTITGLSLSGSASGNYQLVQPTTTADIGALFITAQPQDRTVDAGQFPSFSVSVNGVSPFTYQWYRSGRLIPGATAASYQAPAAVLADDGARFTVVVSNAGGSETSAIATLTVNPSSTDPLAILLPDKTAPFAAVVGETIRVVIHDGTPPYVITRNGATVISGPVLLATGDLDGDEDLDPGQALVLVPTSTGTATLTVTDHDGTVATVSLAITQLPTAVNPAPSIPLTAGETTVYAAICPGTAAGLANLRQVMAGRDHASARMFAWDALFQEFVEFPTEPVGGLVPSDALFLASREALPIDFDGSPAPLPYAILLRPGWNFVGVPPLTADGGQTVIRRSLLDASVADDFVLNDPTGAVVARSGNLDGAYWWNGAAYANSPLLESGKGYWIRNRATQPLFLRRLNTGIVRAQFATVTLVKSAEAPPAPPSTLAAQSSQAGSGKTGGGCGSGGGLAALGLVLAASLLRARRR